ncbi:monocyte chemotactic protein 1B-like [Engraulis encrasicolus]|uniref:monocyte chemotactic protein 1B-like n=1 Tax=Engraulis encrasicolus TaxID=184585 RepID=UPI002FD5371A
MAGLSSSVIPAGRSRYRLNINIQTTNSSLQSASSLSSIVAKMKTLIALTAVVLIVAVNAQYSPTTTECCPKHYLSPIPGKKVVSYITTSSRCNLKAHVFTTVAGKVWCVDPDLDWVQKIVTKLDEKNTAATPTKL